MQSSPEEDLEPILCEEVEIAVAALKKGESAGVDNIPAELFQASGKTIIDVSTEASLPYPNCCSEPFSCAAAHLNSTCSLVEYKNSVESYVAPGKDHAALSDNALYLYQVLPKCLIVTDLDSRAKLGWSQC